MPRLVREEWTFALLSGAETAQMGWYWVDAASAPVAALDVALVGARNLLWGDWKTLLHSSTELTEINLVETDIATGNVISVTPSGLPAGGLTGTGVVNAAPSQLTQVMSLRTATPGPRGRGRFYTPAMANGGYGVLGQLAPTTRETWVDAFADYVNSVETGLTYELCVYSRATASTPVVTQVDMGSVPDTQRRRRNRLVEARYSRTV